jgi:hypothetical protein
LLLAADGVHRGLISEVIARFERKGYKLVGIKVLVPTQVRKRLSIVPDDVVPALLHSLRLLHAVDLLASRCWCRHRCTKHHQ